MLQLLHSHKPPLNTPGDLSLFETFSELAVKSDHITITTGYISVDASLFLLENINKLPRLDVLLGMHGFEGFSSGQYSSCTKLAKEMVHNGGNAYICKAWPYHGKVYSFHKDGEPFAAIVGSSNSSCLTPAPTRSFETDILFDDPKLIASIVGLQRNIITKASVPFLEFNDPKITDPAAHNHLEAITTVSKLTVEELAKIIATKTGLVFDLELKTTSKSNLNAYHGKGRESTKTGLIRSRPWYEVELIVSKKVTTLSGYPRCAPGESFWVVTDDGYKFECSTNGDYYKNFRSKGDLSILGAWIKGRLESRAGLKAGEYVTDQVLNKFGKRHISLVKTTVPGTWFLTF
jgi:hypothetical protein